jgi:hypothetical protein
MNRFIQFEYTDKDFVVIDDFKDRPDSSLDSALKSVPFYVDQLDHHQRWARFGSQVCEKISVSVRFGSWSHRFGSVRFLAKLLRFRSVFRYIKQEKLVKRYY